MRLRFRDIHIRRLLLAALLCLGLSSCVYDDGLEPDVLDRPDTPMMISFEINLQSDRNPVSRAWVWGEGHEQEREQGEGYDNEISSLWIGIYDSDTENKVAEVKNIFKLRETTSEDKYPDVQKVKYEYTGEISAEEGYTFPADNKKYTVVVILNTPDMDNYPTGTLKDLEEVKYYPYFTSEKGVTTATHIPMFGFQKGIDFSGMTFDKVFEIGDIYMLRAMAKVRVGIDRNDPESKKWKLTSLNVVNSNDRGYVASEYNNWKDIESLLKLTTNEAPAGGVGGKTFHNWGNNHVAHSIAIPSDKDPVFYLTEQCVYFTPECKLEVTLTDDKGTEKDGTIYFHYYENGEMKQIVDIIRNHFYQFTIKVDPRQETLRFHVTIADMENGGVFNYEYDFDE